MKVKVIKIISFVLIFCVLLYSINRVLRFKYDDGIYQLDVFYKQPKDSIDVLILGSSHAYMNISQFYLYSLYGIASYNLGGGSQPLWNSYFYLKEALKTQKPKLIVLDILQVRFDYEYMPKVQIINNTYGIKGFIDKINSIKISSQKSDWKYFLNPFYQYHDRYSSLTFEDFLEYRGKNKYVYFKGYKTSYRFSSNIKPNISGITNIYNLFKKSENYYRLIIELSITNKIPILIVKTPHASITQYHQEKYNMAKEIADEYNVHFINMNLNYDEYFLDFSMDFSDKQHLNYIGAEKVAKYLGKYLKENYDLPDRRGDPKYYSWEMNAKYEYKRIYNIELKQYTNFNEYIEKVKNANDYVIGITMLGNYKKDGDIVKSVASNFNINDIYLKNASYVVDNNKLIYSSSGSNQYLFYDEIGSYTDLVLDSGQKLSINRKNYIKTKNGINMVIYDKFTEEIVDNIYLEYKGNSINPTIKR